MEKDKQSIIQVDRKKLQDLLEKLCIDCDACTVEDCGCLDSTNCPEYIIEDYLKVKHP